MSEITWKLSKPDKEKIPYTPQLKITDDMGDGQKEFARLFNLMRQTCLNNDLMEKK